MRASAGVEADAIVNAIAVEAEQDEADEDKDDVHEAEPVNEDDEHEAEPVNEDDEHEAGDIAPHEAEAGRRPPTYTEVFIFWLMDRVRDAAKSCSDPVCARELKDIVKSFDDVVGPADKVKAQTK